MACVLVLSLYWPFVVTVIVVVTLVLVVVRSFGWLVGCLLFDCVSGGHGGGCGVCGDRSGGGGGNGGNIVSLHSCWLCNWPLGWSVSTQINKELITTTTTTITATSSTTTSSSSSSSSFFTPTLVKLATLLRSRATSYI